MITESQMYWITRCSSFKELAAGVGLLLLLISVALSIACASFQVDGEIKPMKRCIKYLKCTLTSAILLFVICTFIPTTKQMCAIKVVPVIVNDENIQKLPENALEFANEWLRELKPSKGEKK